MTVYYYFNWLFQTFPSQTVVMEHSHEKWIKMYKKKQKQYRLHELDRSAGHADKDLLWSCILQQTSAPINDRTGGSLPKAADINTATRLDGGRQFRYTTAISPITVQCL